MDVTDAPVAVRIALGGVKAPLQGFALIDIEDAERVLTRRWCLNSQGYVRTGTAGTAYLLHRFVLGLERGDGKIVDHINRNKLDNRKSNLRLVTVAENNRNRDPDDVRGVIPIKGICWDSKRMRYRATLFHEGKRYASTYLDTLEEARDALNGLRAVCGLDPV